MGKLTNQKKLELLKIKKYRKILEMYLKEKIVDESDIIDLLRFNSSYVFLKDDCNSKRQMLKNIFNCPFLLCDQPSLSLNMKKILPFILKCRYDMEMEEIELQFELGYISKVELDYNVDMLKFCYYESSMDGKSILKEGHAKRVVDNIVRVKKYV